MAAFIFWLCDDLSRYVFSGVDGIVLGAFVTFAIQSGTEYKLIT